MLAVYFTNQADQLDGLCEVSERFCRQVASFVGLLTYGFASPGRQCGPGRGVGGTCAIAEGRAVEDAIGCPSY